jgi:hypothetical protein
MMLGKTIKAGRTCLQQATLVAPNAEVVVTALRSLPLSLKLVNTSSRPFPAILPSDPKDAEAQQRRSFIKPQIATKEVARSLVIDSVGAVSLLSQLEQPSHGQGYKNLDGQRIEDGRYSAFQEEISSFIPSKERIFTDAVRTYGS